MSPQEAARLVGHSPAQKEDSSAAVAAPFDPAAGDIVERARWSAASTEVHEDFAPYGTMIDALADEIERLRCALRAVRASTDPAWQLQIIRDALREGEGT